MEIKCIEGTDSRLYGLVGPLVMNPSVISWNNGYPFKTTFRHIWYVACEGNDVSGFMPLKPTADGYCIDNYYVRGDNTDVLAALLDSVLADYSGQDREDEDNSEENPEKPRRMGRENPKQGKHSGKDRAELTALVHKRHVEIFASRSFRTVHEWKKYDKMAL